MHTQNTHTYEYMYTHTLAYIHNTHMLIHAHITYIHIGVYIHIYGNARVHTGTYTSNPAQDSFRFSLSSY